MAKTSMKLAFLAGAAALGIASAASAAGPTASMLSNTCAGCHGEHGNSVGPASPTIAQMEKEAFIETMEGFKTGAIYSTIMGRIAEGYTEEEIELMAGYFSGQTYIPAKQSFDEGSVKKGQKLHDKYCEKCHAEGGKPVRGEEDEEYYILAGQWTPYLQYAMTDFQEKRREMPKKMKKKLDKMIEKEGDAGLEALYAFYASQQ
ncbi:MAG: cytochrome c4 [Pseudomonadota bacterium]|nr:cytochrome c4 [Pseudomonadota bacterium]